ncbi:unnamed protein product, partial [Prorocentrum cordatum]
MSLGSAPPPGPRALKRHRANRLGTESGPVERVLVLVLVLVAVVVASRPQAAQLAYEEQMHAARVMIAQNEAKIVFLEGVIAKTEQEKADEIELMNQNSALLTDEETYLHGILPDCQWVFKAFFERADKRAAEMEGLTTAK